MDNQQPFDRTEFFRALRFGAPLYCLAVLNGAIETGSIAFPAGTHDDESCYLDLWIVIEDLDIDYGLESGPVIDRYEHLWKDQHGQDFRQPAFPLGFVRTQLQRLYNGEHPMYCSWAIGTLEFLLNPETREPEDNQIAFPHGVI